LELVLVMPVNALMQRSQDTTVSAPHFNICQNKIFMTVLYRRVGRLYM